MGADIRDDLRDLIRLRVRFGTILADPPWRFQNRTGKVAPEYSRLYRYSTLSLEEIGALPIPSLVLPKAHLYLWVPNALLPEGLRVLKNWGFAYKTVLVWVKMRGEEPDRRGVGFYFRNATELILFGTRGNLRTFRAGRRQPNVLLAPRLGHSRKPDALYSMIERCSPGPYLELFARRPRRGWISLGDELPEFFS